MSAHHLNPKDNAFVAVHNLRRLFTLQTDWWTRLRQPPLEVVAVDNLSLQIRRGSTVALVGESGCGKSTTGRCILGLLPPTGGSILFDGEDIVHADAPTRRRLRRRMQMIFQDPYSSLNPRLSAGRMLQQVVSFHSPEISKAEQRAQVLQLLTQVGLNASHLERYPHQLSGGQRQRLGIARALAVNPEFIVCDEPVSALDVSVQAQIINLLIDLQIAHGLTYLFVSHDLRLVRYISSEVAVMYRGQIVEQAPTEELFTQPHHPYTRALLAAIPSFNPANRQYSMDWSGESVVNQTGCPFRYRCPVAMPNCTETPPWLEVAPQHWSRCWLNS